MIKKCLTQLLNRNNWVEGGGSHKHRTGGAHSSCKCTKEFGQTCLVLGWGGVMGILDRNQTRLVQWWALARLGPDTLCIPDSLTMGNPSMICLQQGPSTLGKETPSGVSQHRCGLISGVRGGRGQRNALIDAIIFWICFWNVLVIKFPKRNLVFLHVSIAF